MQQAHTQSDVTDVAIAEPPIDTLDDVLAIAGEILTEYAGERGTRIERLARWLVANVGGEPFHSFKQIGPRCERIQPSGTAYALLRAGGVFAIECPGGEQFGFAIGAAGARAFAVALLRAAERYDAEG